MALEAIHKETTFKVGDFIRVSLMVKEGEKEKTSFFEGTVMSISGRQENKMFSVRRMAVDGIGVERTFPLLSPTIVKITVKRKGKVRRAKLNYLRNRSV